VFNLIVTHEPGLDNYRWARNQLRQLLGESIRYVGSYQSVILYDVDEDPHEVATRLRNTLKGSGTPIIRIIPIDYVSDPYINDVAEVVKGLATKLPEGASFRITLEGHLYYRGEDGKLRRMHTLDSIKELAKYVDNPVNLENPQYVVYVKVVRYFRGRRKAGISLVKPEEISRVSS